MTCGTLLSSQGTGAHQSQSFDRFWGNPPNLTTWIRGVKLTACRSILLSCQTSDLEFTDRPYLLSVSQWRPNFSRTSGNESNRTCFCRKCPEFPLTKKPIMRNSYLTKTAPISRFPLRRTRNIPWIKSSAPGSKFSS